MTTSTYDSHIENGIKSALYTLEQLIEEKHITDISLLTTVSNLHTSLVDAQCGLINCSPEAYFGSVNELSQYEDDD